MIDNEILKQAIKEYRKTGKKLMFDLGNKYGLDISKSEDFETLIARSNKTIPKKGALTQRWNYCFLGGACCFYNKKHLQTVEVELSNLPEFGHLDAWFLMRFLESTERYKQAVLGINWIELKPLLQDLYINKEVVNIKSGVEENHEMNRETLLKFS
jgi:hypothetical protein